MIYRREIREALQEDRAWKDITSRGFIPASARARARLVARERGVLAGSREAGAVFQCLDPRCRVRYKVRDGSALRPGRVVLEVSGPLRSLLSAERTALNFIMHLSGVATLTHEFVRRAGRACRILETRKTIPGLRALEKRAVLSGGGGDHRPDLASAVLVKENHLAFFRGEKGRARFIAKVGAFRRKGISVEMECRDREEDLLGLRARADILLLDNIPASRLAGLVRWIWQTCRKMGISRPLLEASGGVTLQSVSRLARSGVDRISVGRLTHSAPALNMSLDVEVS